MNNYILTYSNDVDISLGLGFWGLIQILKSGFNFLLLYFIMPGLSLNCQGFQQLHSSKYMKR